MRSWRRLSQLVEFVGFQSFCLLQSRCLRDL
nr:MAG TPA: hypothetical protein [Caudoviricetes sp.]